MTDIDDVLIALFHEQFQTPTEAGFPHDRESEDGYSWQTEAVETEDAMVEVFDEALSESKIVTLTDKLNAEAPQWARVSDLEKLGD